MLEPKPVDDGSQLKKPGTTPETEQTKSDQPTDQTEEKKDEYATGLPAPSRRQPLSE